MNTYIRTKKLLDELSIEHQGALVDFDWAEPTTAQHGFFTSSAAFKLAKAAKKPPVAIARELTSLINKAIHTDEVCLKQTGPYINVSLSSTGLQAAFNETDTWKLELDAETKVLFEYVGLNVAKKPHVGHMRNINIGEALYRILRTKYTQLISDNHWGDWGVQFGIVIWAYKRNLDKAQYKSDPLAELQRLYVWGNAQKDEIDDWEAQVRAEFKKLEDGDSENHSLWAEFVELSQQATKGILDYFNVTPHDLNQGESFYEPQMKALAAYMDSNGIWEQEGQARYFDLETMIEKGIIDSSKKLGRCYLISSAGYTTYAFRDVAARLQWMDEHNVDLAVTIADYKQTHNFDQAFAIISYLASRQDFKKQFGKRVAQKLKIGNLKFLPYGRLNIAGKNISSRSGGALELEDLTEAVKSEFNSNENKTTLSSSDLDKAVIAALKWQDLNRDRMSDYDLDPAKIIEFEGDTGVYQLYTVARLNSILDTQSDLLAENQSIDLLNDRELAILGRIVWGTANLQRAAAEYSPHYVANHLRELTQLINAWYAKDSIINEPNELRKQQMYSFVRRIKRHIESGLELLGIHAIAKL